jgi:peptidoglycan/xylan/chitin deacetylase (PgdA/CDA1 family)
MTRQQPTEQVASSTRPQRGRPRCLVFHYFAGDAHDPREPLETASEQILRLLDTHATHLAGLHDYVDAFLRSEVGDLLSLTVDDGYSCTAAIFHPLLLNSTVKPTVFICPSLVGVGNRWNPRAQTDRRMLSWDELKWLTDDGWDIGCHGYDHVRMRRKRTDELKRDFESALADCHRHLRRSPRYLAYPYGDYDARIASVATDYFEAAFAVDATAKQEPCVPLRFRLPRTPATGTGL